MKKIPYYSLWFCKSSHYQIKNIPVYNSMKMKFFSFGIVNLKIFKNVVFKTGAIVSFWAARGCQYTGDRTVFLIDRTVLFVPLGKTQAASKKFCWQKRLLIDRTGFCLTEVTVFFIFIQKQKCPFQQNFRLEVSFSPKFRRWFCLPPRSGGGCASLGLHHYAGAGKTPTFFKV